MTEQDANVYIDECSETFLQIEENHIYMSAVKANKKSEEYTIEIGVNEKIEGGYMFSNKELSKDEMIDIKGMKNKLKEDSDTQKQNRNTYKSEITNIFVPVGIHNLKIRPLISGSAINSEKSNSKIGTLGAFFQMEGENSTYFLTNYHNLSFEKPAVKGDLIFQPNNKDYDFKNLIGHYLRGQYYDVREGERVSTTLDYAIVKLNIKAVNPRLLPYHDVKNIEYNLFRLENHSYGFISNDKDSPDTSYLKGIDEPITGSEVSFHGSTTVISCKANIKSKKATVKVRDIYDNKKVNIFKNQILINKPCQNGDSGSVLVNSKNKIVGLIHASNLTSYSIANNINEIFCQKDCVECKNGKSCSKIKLKNILT